MLTMLLHRYPLLSRLFLFFILPVLLGSIVIYGYLVKSIAIKTGQLSVHGLTQAATIQYDKNFIPTIQSDQDAPVFFALGFAHAQNRLWQMEMNRRIASGRLSEIVGQQGLASDKFMRVMGLSHNAKKMWQQLPKTEQEVLSHYVAGVNAGIKELSVLPPEFLLYHSEPEPWTEIDSLLWMQLLTLQLSSNMGDELRRAALLPLFDQQKLQQIMNVDAVALDGSHTAVFTSDPFGALNYFLPKPFVGSNSWVVSGRFTQSGLPLLANDPHLNLTQPSVFYLAKLKGDRLNVEGATFPGLPFVVIGHNSHIAWGLTNMMADTQDIFIEQTNPHNINQYLYDGQFQDMTLTHERIDVKAQWLKAPVKPTILTVRRTIHGPVVSDLVAEVGGPTYALRWTGDDQNGGTFESFLALNYARNWSEFRSALSRFVAPVHNFTYADKQGNIGRYAPGFIPVRATGTGALPRQGWHKENDWQGWIPYAQLPQAFNPETGFIIAANNNFLDKNYPHHITADWVAPYRAQRIEELITEQIDNGKLFTEHDFINIQQDTALNTAAKTRDFIQNLFSNSTLPNPVRLAVKTKIDDLSSDSISAALIATWQAQFTRLLLEDDTSLAPDFSAAKAALTQMQNEESQILIDRVLASERTQWCDYRLTEGHETCQELAEIALHHAVHELTKKYGAEPLLWRWGNIHKAQLPHTPFSHARYLSSMSGSEDSVFSFIFHRETESAGNANALNVGPIAYDEARRFEQLVGSVYRQIINLDNVDAALFSSATGQSGNPLSRHYDDLMVNHFMGSYVPITAPEPIETLTLNPIKHHSGN